MAEVNEDTLFDKLLDYKTSNKFYINGSEIALSLIPCDIHRKDCPDFFLFVNLSINMFGQELTVKIPIPIEAEKGGIYGGALDDLRKFVERGNYPIEIPMLVIAESGYLTKINEELFPVKFTITQVPVRVLSEPTSPQAAQEIP